MSHNNIPAATRSRSDVARTVRSPGPKNAPPQRVKPANGPGRQNVIKVGRRPTGAAGGHRFRARSIRDRVGAVVAGTGAGAVLTIMALAASGAPTAAYGAIGAIGAGATAATGVYLGKK